MPGALSQRAARRCPPPPKLPVRPGRSIVFAQEPSHERWSPGRGRRRWPARRHAALRRPTASYGGFGGGRQTPRPRNARTARRARSDSFLATWRSLMSLLSRRPLVARRSWWGGLPLPPTALRRSLPPPVQRRSWRRPQDLPQAPRGVMRLPPLPLLLGLRVRLQVPPREKPHPSSPRPQWPTPTKRHPPPPSACHQRPRARATPPRRRLSRHPPRSPWTQRSRRARKRAWRNVSGTRVGGRGDAAGPVRSSGGPASR